MAKKKNIKQADLISYYMDYVLTHSQQPKSVYVFAKDNNFEEQQFYQFFSSFDVLEILEEFGCNWLGTAVMLLTDAL